MGLFKTMVWSWKDIWILKWCAFVFGMIAGAYLSEFIKQKPLIKSGFNFS